jgi:biopolymer transport protein ExbB
LVIRRSGFVIPSGTLPFEVCTRSIYTSAMLISLAQAGATHSFALFAAATSDSPDAGGSYGPITLLTNGGLMLWLILATSAIALSVFVERLLHYHREHINTAEFLNGVRTVLKRDNTVEAISICDATPGPVPRLVKTAIIVRDQGRERVREAIDDAGLVEVPRLEEKLTILATIAQIAPLLGLIGTVMGFMHVFDEMQQSGLTADVQKLAKGVWKALICTGAGLAVAAVAYAFYNYLVARVNDLVLEMEKSATEIVNMVIESVTTKKP